MRLLTLPPHVLRKLLEHEVDTLTPKVEERRAKYSKPCPRCGGAMHEKLAAERPFDTHSMLPRTYAWCVDCGCEIDTQTGIMVKTGNPAKVEPTIPLIDPED